MANYNLNDARKIVYLDKNGEQQVAKEVWYIGSTGSRYKVWPGDIYLTDIKIVDPSGYEYDLEYVNGEPTYKRNNITYTGLSPNTKYHIKGTLRVMRYQGGVNTLVDEIENCYPMHYTVKESSGDIIWVGTNEGEKYNPMVDMNVSYNVYKCTEAYSSKGDNNVFFIPTMGYWTPWVENGQVMLGLQGELKDLGIKLKRAQRKSTFTVPSPSKTTFKYNESGSLDETTISGISYVTYWDGPDRLESTRSWSVSSSHANILSVTKGGTNATIKCIKAPTSDTNVTVTFTPESIQGYSASSKTFTFKVKGVQYRATLNGYTVYSGKEYNVPLTETRTITVERSFDDGVTWSQFSPTLSAGSQIVTISNNGSVVPQSEGTTTIYVTVDGEKVMSIPITIDLPDEPASCYVTVTVSSNTGNYSTLLNREYISENTIKTARISNSSWNNISIQFHAASTGNVQQTVYWTKSGSVSNWAGLYDGSGNSISMYKNSSGGTGTITLTIGSKSGRSDLGKLELIFN